MDGHCSRASLAKGRKYLSPQLSVAKMHEMSMELYEPLEFQKLKEGLATNLQGKYEFYRQYFNMHLNLSFGAPKTDTCSTCDELNVKINNERDPVKKQRLQMEKQSIYIPHKSFKQKCVLALNW